MNLLEKKMVDILKDLKENHHVIGAKAEFEAEGTRLEEALRLKEVLMKADIPLTIKIGGCEALRDIYEARVIGVSRIVSPMVESPYALTKFLSAVESAFPKEEREDVAFAINIETGDAVRRFDEFLAIDAISRLDGIVIGRVDLSRSLGLDNDSINTEAVMVRVMEVLAKAKRKDLECAIGGGVSADSLPAFRKIPKGHLDYYETRKVIFGCPQALGPDGGKGILKAVGFELAWLKNKREFYGMIFEEDKQRLGMLEERYKKMINQLGVRI